MNQFKTTSLADQVFEKLENDIIQGVYPRGEILTELKLVDQLGVSRTPIRDALRRLEQERLIEDTGKGSRVVGITEEDLEDIMNIRQRIEGLAAYYAAKNMTPEGLAAMAAEIKPVLPALIAGGHRFMYHNHHMEFARFDGKTFLDLLCETFTPEECGVTLDTYWVQAGGGDPAYWLRRLSGRVDCVHFKDMVFSPEDKAVRMAAIGDGNMNYPEILRACEDAGVQYAFVEQDNCYGVDPFLCLKRSYDWLHAQGLE